MQLLAYFKRFWSGVKDTSTAIVKAVGELPGYIAPARIDRVPKALDARVVPPDPFSGWWLALPDKLQPKEISSILRAALAGNLWQQTQLVDRMLESWPMLRKCSHELRNAVAQARYCVHPHEEPDEEASPKAKEKAELVRRNLENFKPNRFSDEEGFSGTVYDLCDSILNGVSITELIWDTKAQDPDGNREKRIRGSAWVHPRHYAFNQNGGIGIAQSEPKDMLQFPTQGGGNRPIISNPSKFLVAKCKTKSGSVLGNGLARVLAYYWVNIVYGRDFLMEFAQNYGAPFLDIAHVPGIDATAISKFEMLARRAASQRWMVHSNEGIVEIKPAQTSGEDNPIIEMMRIADEACQMLLLGQTLTSTAPANGGTRAQGDVHMSVREEKIEQYSKWMAEILTEQFAETLLQENYGETSERPTIEVDMDRPLNAAEKSTLLTAVSNSSLALPVTETYKLLGFTVPQEGKDALVRGERIIVEAPMKQSEKEQQDFERQLQNQSTANEVLGDNPPAKMDSVKKTVKSASQDDLDELRALVLQAKEAQAQGKLNGEWTKIQIKMKEINRL